MDNSRKSSSFILNGSLLNQPNSNSTAYQPSPFSMSSQGKFVQQLCKVEEENKLLRVELDDLKKWKIAVESWLKDAFGMTITPTSIADGIPDANDNDDSESVGSNDTDTRPAEYGFIRQPNFAICNIKTEEIEAGVENDETEVHGSNESNALLNSTEPILCPESDNNELAAKRLDDTDTVAVLSVCENKELESAMTDNVEHRGSTSTAVVLMSPLIDLTSEPNCVKADNCSSGNEVLAGAEVVTISDEEDEVEVIPKQTIDQDKDMDVVVIDQNQASESNGLLEICKPTVGVAGKGDADEYEFTASGSAVEDKTPCDVCRAILPEDTNNMIYCETCNVCVHQACYGVSEIPEGDWNCQPCAAKIPVSDQKCRFCTTTGGALVRVKSPKNNTWAHVSCTWWIPGVHINKPAKMDMVVGMPNVDSRRYNLLCIVCKSGRGTTCCIQCCYKRCSTAFHVTCGFKSGFRMEMVDDDSADEGVRLLPYCNVHRRIDITTSIDDLRRRKGSVSPHKKKRRMN